MGKEQLQVTFSVLAYREKKQWVALALEMDIRGYGKTCQEAIKEMSDLVRIQASFAFSRNEPHMIWYPAEPHWFQLYAEIRSRKLFTSNRAQAEEYDAGSMPFPVHPALLKGKERFLRTDA